MTENSVSEPLEDEEQTPPSESQPPPSESEGEQHQRHDERTSSPSTTTWNSSFFTLLALFIAFRLLTLLLLRPGGFIRDWSDFDTYLGIAALSDYGLYPFLHYWLEWPPLVPWLAVGAYQLSLLFPPWTDNRLWFVLILGTVFVLFETGNFVLLYRIAGRARTPLNDAETPPAVDNPSEKAQSPTNSELKATEIEEPDAGDEGRETQPKPTGRSSSCRSTQCWVSSTRSPFFSCYWPWILFCGDGC
jgi:hypothetical protein